jgi:uncharacterized membrane protein YfcA
MKPLIVALVVGEVAGLLGALCGVGGGIVMVPAFAILLGMTQKAAVATSMAVIIVTSIAATASNVRAEGLIDWRIVGFCAGGAAVASYFGSEWMRALSNETLVRIFGITLIAFGARMLWRG